MFGYLRPCKAGLSEDDLSLYRAVYCGLCHAMGERYSPLSRLFLSYDFALLALLYLSLEGGEEGIALCPRRCAAHPFAPRKTAGGGPAIGAAAAAAALGLYYKNLDDRADFLGFRKLRPLLLHPLFTVMRRRARALYPALDLAYCEMAEAQREAERDPNCSLDRAAEPTGALIRALVGCAAGPDTERGHPPDMRQPLARFSYALGRWVYIADALDDLARDRRRGDFNPLAHLPPAEAKQQALRALVLTENELLRLFPELPLRRGAAVIDNLLREGLPAVRGTLGIPKKELRRGRSAPAAENK